MSAFDDITLQQIGKFAAEIGCSPYALLAVVEVESNAVSTAMVAGKPEPLIRIEGHYFDRRLTGEKRERARAAGLAAPRAGAVKNPASQAKRWQMLARMIEIDAEAAYESCSWGVGQVMGAHWKALGFTSVQGFVARCRAGVVGQIDVMVRFIRMAGLADELQRLDFTGFARGYNGPAYAKHGYHTKMGAAYRKLSGEAPVSAAQGMLRMGSSGARVRELQALLSRAGFPVKVDGDYGPTTKKAVMAFQRAQGVTVDGVAGPETIRQLDAFRQAPGERPGGETVMERPETKQGLGTAVTGGSLEVASQQLDSAGERLAWIPGLETVGGILSLVAVVLVVSGLIWVAYGWLRSRQTDEGDVGDTKAAWSDAVLDLQAILLCALPGLLALTAIASAHEAKMGWSYPNECCSGYDCREVSAAAVGERPDGYVIKATGEEVGTQDPRLKRSPDGLYHWCSQAGRDDGKTICLFVPPRSF